ncbi:MAG: metallophosphoesterase [Myxococcota bacterium]
MRWTSRSLPRGARVVCFSDVHGNMPALEAVLEAARPAEADLVIVHGDIVNRGPRSDQAWDRIAGLVDPRWLLTSGNHERYVRAHLAGPAHDGVMAEVHRTSAWTFAQLGGRVAALEGLLDGVMLESPGLPEIRVVHASLVADDRGLSPRSPEAHLRTADGPWGMLIVGHVHRTYDFRTQGDVRVVNAGSVGSACDGIPRAGWIEIEADPSGWSVRRFRVEYDRSATERDYQTSGFLTEAGPVARLIHREWQLARPTVRPWFEQELEPVKRGERSLADSVETFLQSWEG